jgi:ABC-type Zn2+ transport system substrate-binding protein/surface adhesin
MKKTLILLLLAGTVGLTTIALFADQDGERYEAHERERHEEGDHDDDHEHHEHRSGPGAAYLSDPQYALYKAECGDCHMAYPPSMLPASSWRAMMGNLEDHFGNNAELDAATASRVTAFLTGAVILSITVLGISHSAAKEKRPRRNSGTRGLV